MKALLFNQATMDSAKAWGLDLANSTEEEIDAVLGYQTMSMARVAGAGFTELTKLCDKGIGEVEVTVANRDEVIEYAIKHGIDPNHPSFSVNCMATVEKTIIFYIDEEADRSSSIEEKVLRALDKVCRAEEIFKTSLWSAFCKRA